MSTPLALTLQVVILAVILIALLGSWGMLFRRKPTTTRTAVLAAARAVIVQEGKCPHCLSDLVKLPDKSYGYCPQHIAVAYSLETGEVLGLIT